MGGSSSTAIEKSEPELKPKSKRSMVKPKDKYAYATNDQQSNELDLESTNLEYLHTRKIKYTVHWVNKKTLQYELFNGKKNIKYNYKPDISEIALTNVLIQFMNLQSVAIRSDLAKELDYLYTKPEGFYQGYRIYGSFKTSDGKDFYAFNIKKFVELDGKKSLHHFLMAMSSLREEKLEKENIDIKYIGFSENMPTNRTKIDDVETNKLLKYKGIINCCIANDNKCSDEETGMFGFGTRRKKSPELCPYTPTPSLRPNNNLSRTNLGGRRHRLYKRKTRRTR
jgi:hypothetical protein